MTLVAVYAGEVVITVDGLSRTLTAGNTSLLSIHKSIHYVVKGNCHFRWCFAPNALKFDTGISSIKLSLSSIPLWDRLDSLLELGMALIKTSNSIEENLKNSLGPSLFYEYLSKAHATEARQPIPRKIQRTAEFIEQRFQEPLNTQDIADAIGLTKTYLISLFKKHMGITPAEYLKQIRLDKAYDLIIQTDMGMVEVADQCGFKNQFHLSRCIKQLYGQPPSILRQKSGIGFTQNRLF